MNLPDLFLGIDIGTSGCRAIAIDRSGTIHGKAFVSFPMPERNGNEIEQDALIWWNSVKKLLAQLATKIDLKQVVALSIDGTSGTIIACDDHGAPLHPGLMYNDARAVQQAQTISAIAPIESAVHGVTSGLAKALWLLDHVDREAIHYLLNQSDWIVGKLSNHYGLSDYNNCLKLGYDPIEKQWPNWLEKLHVPFNMLSTAHRPGEQITHLSSHIADEFGFNKAIPIFAGTTDSTAAVYATGAEQPGDAITSLGSTLVTKVISNTPLFIPECGVYSQPFGQFWLVGGGSNSGGNVLLHYFTPSQMTEMSQNIDPNQSPNLDYYPLLTPGERFPISNPNLAPKLEPRPEEDTLFFHGLLEGITNIEKQANDLLAQHGAPYPKRIYSAGGGAINTVWTQIRANILGAEMLLPEQQDAAYGVAKIARDGYLNYTTKA